MTGYLRKARALWPVAIAGAFATGSAAEAAQISFGHFAPAAGTVAVELDGHVVTTLEYRGFDSKIALDAGRHLLRAVAQNGLELARGELEMSGIDVSTVMLAGNGTAAAPYELRVSLDHNHPLAANAFSLQVASVVVSADGGPVESRRTCGPMPSALRDDFSYGNGSGSIADPDGGGANLYEGSLDGSCGIELFVGGQLRSNQLIAREPGARIRAFGIGDGVNEPYEMLVVQQGKQPEPRMQLGAGVAGLWYPAGDKPGISVVVAYDAERPEGRRFSALLSGFGGENDPTWLLIDDELRIVEYRGGNPSGTRPALPRLVGYIEKVVWHSCTELTLVPSFDDLGVFNRGPRNAMRLKRLLPAPCEPTTPQPEVL